MNAELFVSLDQNQSETAFGHKKPSKFGILRAEEGLTTVETVLLIFVAVLILLALVAFFNDTVYTKVKQTIQNLLNKTIS